VGVPLVSLVTLPDEGGPHRVVVRLGTIDPRRAVAALSAAGVCVVRPEARRDG
jgi:hypothetical protein